ncbi:MAG: VWA domain-containing protein [Phycisphaerales bacterium]|nr:VWA domain-containing protein [Phycisphaerales bacterium]
MTSGPSVGGSSPVDALGGSANGSRDTGKGSASGSGDLQGVVPSTSPKPANPTSPPDALAPVAPSNNPSVPTDALSVKPVAEELTVPKLDLSPIDTPTTASILDHAGTPIELASGAWEQIGLPANNGPDFGPGGYIHSYLIIDGKRNECFLYRTFGNVTVSGQFRMTLDESGVCTIGPSSVRPTEFPSQPRTIPLGGGATCTITPPSGKTLTAQWSSRASDSTMIIHSKEYRRIPKSVAERIVRGEPVLSGAELDIKIEQTAKGPSGKGAGGSAEKPTPKSGAAHIDFFGTEIRGRHVAFVIDNSGSMGDDGKLDAAKAELIRAIKALPKDTNIFVVFFSNAAFTIPGFEGWIPAQSRASADLVQAISGVPVLGGTDPTSALQLAFRHSPRPDQIFFMTDGLMQIDARSLVAQLNGQSKARTRIDTFAVGNDADQAMLSAVAADNDGQFQKIH